MLAPLGEPTVHPEVGIQFVDVQLGFDALRHGSTSS
jgi:hypothetical protein